MTPKIFEQVGGQGTEPARTATSGLSGRFAHPEPLAFLMNLGKIEREGSKAGGDEDAATIQVGRVRIRQRIEMATACNLV